MACNSCSSDLSTVLCIWNRYCFHESRPWKKFTVRIILVFFYVYPKVAQPKGRYLWNEKVNFLLSKKPCFCVKNDFFPKPAINFFCASPYLTEFSGKSWSTVAGEGIHKIPASSEYNYFVEIVPGNFVIGISCIQS